MKTKSKDVNLHELNKYLKTHAVSADSLESLIDENEKFRTPRKAKPEKESYENWKMREGIQK